MGPPAPSALGIRGRKNLPAPRALPFALLSPFIFFFSVSCLFVTVIHSPGSSGSWSVPRVTMVLESLGLLTSRQHLQLLLARCLARQGPSGGQAGGAGPEAGTSPPRQTSATRGVPVPQRSDPSPGRGASPPRCQTPFAPGLSPG